MLKGEHTSGALARPSLQVRGSLCPRGPALLVAHDDPEAHGSGWRRGGRRPFDPDGGGLAGDGAVRRAERGGAPRGGEEAENLRRTAPAPRNGPQAGPF